MSQESDAELLQRCAAGDREAYAVLVVRHHGLVRAACLRQAAVGDEDDCVQAVFLVLLRRPRAAARVQALPAWLLRVAWYVCRNSRRVAGRRQRAERSAAALACDDGQIQSEALHHLDDCLLKLPARQREAVTMHFLAGHTPDEVASSLRTSRENAYQLISRGLAGLRAQFTRRGVVVSGTALASLMAAEADAALSGPPDGLLRMLSPPPAAAVAARASGAITAMTVATLSPFMVAAGILIAAAATLLLPAATAAGASERTPIPAAAAAAEPATGPLPHAVRSAAERGLDWLVAHQRADGSWAADGETAASPGVAALCTLGLLGAAPDAPRTAAIAKGIGFLRQHPWMQAGMAPAVPARHTLYDHGFATMCLSQAMLLTGDATLRQELDAAVRLIVAAQNPQGGWRYSPMPRDADVSVTATQLVALHAARQAGIAVPDETIERALTYVRSCCNRTAQGGDGGFAYMADAAAGYGSSLASGYARTAAAAFALLLHAPDTEARLIRDALAFVGRFPTSGPEAPSDYVWYGRYYAAALHRMGMGDQQSRQSWPAWHATTSAILVDSQLPDGHWAGEPAAMPTAIACLVLLMPENPLPIFSTRSPEN